MTDQRIKNVWVDYSFVETEMLRGGDVVRVTIHDAWDDKRKKQPVYILDVDVRHLGCAITSLIKAYVEAKELVISRLMAQHRRIRQAVDDD